MVSRSSIRRDDDCSSGNDVRNGLKRCPYNRNNSEKKLVQDVPQVRQVRQANKVQSAPAALIPIASARL